MNLGVDVLQLNHTYSNSVSLCNFIECKKAK